MRLIPALIAVILPQAALAHVGHLGELAGHSHWIALGALGVATAIGLLAGGRKDQDAEPEEGADTSEEAEEAPA